MPEILTVEDVAALMRLSRAHVRRLLAAGELPGRRRGRRWYVLGDELAAVFRANPDGIDERRLATSTGKQRALPTARHETPDTAQDSVADAASDELLPIGIAGRMLGCAPRTLQRWDADGRLVALRDAHGRRFYRRSDVERLRPTMPLPRAAADGGAQVDGDPPPS